MAHREPPRSSRDQAVHEIQARLYLRIRQGPVHLPDGEQDMDPVA
ncbi:hypothetical protein ACWELB_00900 [Streptomyces asiaticus]